MLFAARLGNGSAGTTAPGNPGFPPLPFSVQLRAGIIPHLAYLKQIE
jgi:hypothetical protein